MGPWQQGQSKPDMVAYKMLRPTLTPPESYGHLPGIKVGDRFSGRGELAILGLHRQILKGIWRWVNLDPWTQNNPICYAI